METNNNQMPQYNNGSSAQAPQFNNVTPMPPTSAPTGNAEHFKKYGLLSLVFGLVYGFCLYNNHASITYPIFMAGALIILKLFRAKDGFSLLADCHGKKGLGVFYVVSLMLLSIHRCMTTSSALEFLERLAIFLLFFSFIVYLYVDTTGFDIGAWFLSLLCVIFKPLEHLARPISDHKAYKITNGKIVDNEKKKTITAVFLGIAIAIPLLIIIIPLLCSADLVFENFLSSIKFDFDISEDVYHGIMMFLTALLGLWSAYTIITSMVLKELRIKVKGEGTTNPVIAITFTSIIGLVYILFCAIQLLYLFSGSIALPEGYTYAEYAHEGFYQLLAVCILNIIMVSICQTFFSKSKVLKILLTLIATCTYIMIASSAMRMILYVEVYHLTFLRLFVLWFLVVLCFWLAFLIASMYVKNFPVFRACMVAITLAFLAFIYSNPDYQIARYDLAAAEEQIDDYDSVKSYICYNLSYDAVPAIVDNEELLTAFKTAHYSRDSEIYIDSKKLSGFRRFNISYYIAKQYLK